MDEWGSSTAVLFMWGLGYNFVREKNLWFKKLFSVILLENRSVRSHRDGGKHCIRKKS